MASPTLSSDPSRRERRIAMVSRIDAELGPFSPVHLAAMCLVPRERFVRAEDERSAEIDTPLPLDDSSEATISAPHAYLLSYRLLELREGDQLLELGSGSGYGAALAAEIVGARGSVVTIEIDGPLAKRAHELLAAYPNVRSTQGDAMEAATAFKDCNKVVCAFAITEVPAAWSRALEPGAVLVAPVGRGVNQELLRTERDGHGALRTTRHDAVRYVPNRSPS
jgi:protein-L-isoaspartate(D-aspartate) O-methyltransferase